MDLVAGVQPGFGQMGVVAVVAVSFARIHHANLVNFGVIPLLFTHSEDYERIDHGDRIVVQLNALAGEITLRNETKGTACTLTHRLRPREIAIVQAGGILNLEKKKSP